ncbi:MAG: hypothetical protein ACRDL7_05225, partial [Gaiellaceae bacterium]
NTVCTNAATHTIRGAGQLLANTGGMENDGMISADLSNTLSIFPNGKGVTNTGTLQATNGGTLLLQSGTFTNTNALIKALDASTVRVNSATVVNGTITTTGSGTFAAEAATFANVTSNGMVTQANGLPAAVTQTLTNNGTWSINSTGANTDLQCVGGATLTGSGSIVMRNSATNRLVTDNTVCQHTAGHTLHGLGQVLVNTGGMQNAGLISADDPAGSLTIFPNGLGFTNTATLQATQGGTLVLQSGTFTNTGGLIQAFDPSTASAIQINSATVVGGTMSTSGVGTIVVAGSTFAGVTSTGTVMQPNGQPATITGTLTNNGTWSMNSSGANTDLNCVAGATLTGSGSIQMANNGNNRLITNNTVCTNAAPHTIRGAGQLLVNTGGLLNKGTILADQTTGMTIDHNANGFTNQGTLHAMGSGGIAIAPDAFTTSGTVLVDGGSSLSRSGAYTQTAGTTTVNGTLSATGLVDIQGGILQGTGT